MRTVVFAVALLLASSAAAQVFKWKDADGVVHFADRPPRDAAAETVAIEPPPPEAGIAPAAPAAAGAPGPRKTQPVQQALDIVMYSRADCGYCARARKYFAQRGIPYRELDVQRSAQARAQWQRLGGNGVPVFVINGNVSHGFSSGGMTTRLRAYGW